jgi:class 3 adenylate cyclase/tetratricopeptide (TPR) repeat protein
MNSCSNCGRENPDDAGFCNGCGSRLVAPAGAREQRKTVTILFCDVTGSTAMGELLDPESLRKVMHRYFDAARKVIEQHGGTVEKFIGDAVMAVFGVPVLHEDDALRAVRAAVGLHEALAGLNSELERDYGTTVTVRTGVNTGPVVTGTEERLATGDAVNVAARLEQAAAPGEIVIGPETWGLVRDLVIVEPLAPLELKGKSLPVSAYRLLGMTGDRADRIGSAMVGRSTQLRMLNDAFANVVDGRSCSMFTVLGAAGVGKSRLTTEFLNSVGATQVRGRCLAYGEGITYWPVISIIKQLLDMPAGAGASALMANDGTVAAAMTTLLGEKAGTTSSTEIAWAVRKLLEAAAETTPLVVVFDDVQWGEQTLFDLIEHIADFSRDAPILILCLGRPELLDRRPGWGGGKLNATTVLLEPLNAADTETLIDELLPAGSGVPAQLRDRVRATAAGNPLFVEEIVAMLRESSSHDVIVPPTIKALLAARFDQLRPEERGLLERGSIEGQSFHRGAVEMMGHEENDVSGRLMTLVRKDLLRTDRPIFAGEDAFTFRHILIRDAAYDSLPKAERAELHARFAAWLFDHGADLEELDEIAGYHLEQAFRYHAELGPVDAEARALAAAGAGHLQAAGRRALDRGDTRAAVNLLERASALLPDQQIEFQLEEALIQGLGMSGRLNDAVARSDRAAAICAAAGDLVREQQARLIGSIWRTAVNPDMHENGLRAAVDAARSVIEQSGDPGALASLEFAEGYAEHHRCRFDAAMRSFVRAMEHAREADEPWLVASARSVAATGMVNGATTIADARAWFALQKAVDGGFLPIFSVWEAWLLASQEHFEEARALYGSTVDRMRERGMAIGVAIVAQVGWRIEMLAGDLETAERVARAGVEELERLGERGWLSTQACQLGEALYALGRYEESEAWVVKGLEMGGTLDVYTQLTGLQVQAKLLARRGDFTGALSTVQRADQLAMTTEAPLLKGDGALALAEVLHLSGDDHGARQAIGRAVEQYEEKGTTAYVAHARRIAATWTEPSADVSDNGSRLPGGR